MRSKWDEMVKALTAFKKKHKHCNVSASDPEHGRLGQWVSSQRYRKRIGALQQDKVDALDKLGFVWSAADHTWQTMFRQLLEYAKKHGTTNIPERCAKNQKLSNWVHNQRHRKKIGRLAPARVRQLEGIGFCWSVRKEDDGEAPPVRELDPPDPPSNDKKKTQEERLYLIRSGVYLQYGGRGRKPRELARFLQSHGGEYPAYIPLPKESVIFTLGNDLFGGVHVEWFGQGPLPKAVMEHVQANGTLPRYEPMDL